LTTIRADDPLLVKKAYREVLEAIDVRIAAVREFLELFKRGIEYDIVPIADVYGPTASDPNIQVLIVSKETMSGANASEYPIHFHVKRRVHTQYTYWRRFAFRFGYLALDVGIHLSFAVAKVRGKKSLPALTTFAIDVISGNADECEELAGEEDVEKLKVAKMGSTYIRRWIVESQGGDIITARGSLAAFA
jgi:pantetheine-phosphate adenylyltransferase